MANVVSINTNKSLEQQAEDWLHTVDVKYAACLAFGHAFPKLRPYGNKRAPKGIILRRYPDGTRELEFACRDCGTTRTIVTEPGASIRFPQQRYIYDRPKGYSRPKGTYELLPKRVIADECARRWEEEQAMPTGGEEFPTAKFSGGEE